MIFVSGQGAGRDADGPSRGSFRRRKGQSASIVLVVAVVTALLSACSSSSHTPSATGSSSTTVGTSGTTVGKTATGSPILIGVSVVSVGSLTTTGAVNGLNGGLYYVNNVLGGVNGHPLKLVMCNSDGSSTTEVNCANNFVSQGVVAVYNIVDGLFGPEAPILSRAGIPVFGLSLQDPDTDHAQSDYGFGAPLEAGAAGQLSVLKAQGFTNLHLSIANVTAAVDFVNAELQPAAKVLGMNVKVTYYDPATINWAVVANSMLAGGPQLVGAISATEQWCDSMLKAIRQTGDKGPVFMGSCSQYVQQDPSNAANTYATALSWNPGIATAAPSSAQTQLAAYESAMKASGNPDISGYGSFAAVAFAGLPDFQYALSQQASGPYTTTSVSSDLHNVTNYQAFLGPELTCDHTKWPGTSSCTNSVLMLKVGSDGQWQSLSPGGFAQIDPNLFKS